MEDSDAAVIPASAADQVSVVDSTGVATPEAPTSEVTQRAASSAARIRASVAVSIAEVVPARVEDPASAAVSTVVATPVNNVVDSTVVLTQVNVAGPIAAVTPGSVAVSAVAVTPVSVAVSIVAVIRVSAAAPTAAVVIPVSAVAPAVVAPATVVASIVAVIHDAAPPIVGPTARTPVSAVVSSAVILVNVQASDGPASVADRSAGHFSVGTVLRKTVVVVARVFAREVAASRRIDARRGPRSRICRTTSRPRISNLRFDVTC
ncbi:hypothetical protein [Nocardia sp. NPDC051463]|uniref:hypothetical protein n=1 Tax=Nocardia sp. NPDC051463 TaxID=3154845 RepID=UPI00344CD82C